MHTQQTQQITMDRQARTFLQAEGAGVFVAGSVAYGALGGDFIWFLPALLLPDLSAVGYLGGPRIGALVYNLIHNWAFGLAVVGAGLYFNVTGVVIAGTVLIAHVGMDRVVGYGLKLLSGFNDTHLGRKGKAARREPVTAPAVVAA